MSDKPIDYRDFKPAQKKEPKKLKAGQVLTSETNIEKWWLADEKHLPAAVLAQVLAIIKNDRTRINDYAIYSRLYGNQSPSPWLSGLAVQPNQSRGVQGQQNHQRVTFNLIQSCVDSLTSKLCKSKPQPFFLTSKGDSKVQRKAKKLNDFCKGVFYQNKAYYKGRIAFRDAAVWGVGILHVYGAHNRIVYDRVMPYELFTDFLESHYGQESTKTLHRVKIIDRRTLMGMFPDKEEEIAKLSIAADIFNTGFKSVSDSVSVIESWRLPSAPDADDGVHCITSSGTCLFVERYNRPNFPFAIVRYSEGMHGFWAQGLAEQLVPIQLELNRCLMSVQRSLYLGGTFKILVHAGSKVVDSHFDNRIGTLIKYQGDVPPSYITPPLIQPEILQQVQSLKNMGYEQSGVSQLSAASLKPAGINSGKGLRETIDIESDRFQAIGQAYEEFYLDLARLSVQEAREMYQRDGKSKVSVNVPGKRFIETVEWKECNLEDDMYVLQCFPISKLPSDPEGRIETIQELMQAGLISPENGRRLLDFPDLAADENLANAQLDYLHVCLDGIVDSGEYTAPEPDDNLQSALKLAIEYLAVGKRDNLEMSRINSLRNYIAQVNDLITAAQPPPPQATTTPGVPPANAGVPPANPEAPPTSNILPNINKG